MGPGILGFSLFAAVALLARPASTVEDPVSGAAPNPSWKQQVDGSSQPGLTRFSWLCPGGRS